MLTIYIFAIFTLTVAFPHPNRRLYQPRQKIHHQQARCARGWVEYHDSCYFIERYKMRFDKAEVNCLQKGSTMFVADSMEEWVS
ncbi:hypothetical protein TELCIR_17235 [Teladorsagia circumcincta]|uniref:C-type lectin domain-containing protein n=1 Tax=Teladorsagia circumcincta TaxID=45464 RepID=A0A2G9TTL9_TELCI|nr:hypothetical protein TELCIR_17235 [Teladorsagia circumcincta]